MELQKILIEIGFSKKESGVYLTLIKEGELTATFIAKLSGIDRVNVYQILEKLKNKGFVSSVVKENKQFFVAAPPKTILSELERKTEIFNNKLKSFESIIGEKTKGARVEVFEGKKGISRLLRLFAEKGDYYFLGGMQEICHEFTEDAYIYVKLAQNNKSKGKIIARKKDDFFIGKNEEYRYLPDKQLSSTSTLIVDDSTIIFIWNKPYYAILIKSKELAENNISNFEYLWNNSKKPTKEDVKNRLV